MKEIVRPYLPPRPTRRAAAEPEYWRPGSP